MAALFHSYTHGASAAPRLNDTIEARLDLAAASGPNRDAIVVCDWFAA